MTTSYNSSIENKTTIKVRGGASVRVAYSCFEGASGVREYHFTLRPVKYAHFPAQYDIIRSAYRETLNQLGLNPDNTVFKRYFCSDAANQLGQVDEDKLEEGAVSYVTEPPLGPAKLSLWAYHIHDPAGSIRIERSHSATTMKRGELEHCWVSNLTGNTEADEHRQSLDIFDRYLDFLSAHGQTLEKNVIRTWFYVSGIDTHYAGMVQARNEVFDREGLTPDTHFIASTGIAGATADPDSLVSMDAYSVGGVHRSQVQFLHALENLGPTHEYGVAFERATAVRYQDRAHIFISGTASINPAGDILHPGDVVGQMERTFCNIEALLRDGGACLDDLSMMIVYVRDPAELQLVQTRIQADYGRIPSVVVLAPVCRPGWLIEIEAIASIQSENPELPPF